jgi:putative ABC transport system permease protein
MLDESERQFLSRARTTTLLIGAKGSSLDLVMNSLYFSDVIPGQISMTATEQIMHSELALPIPLYVRFKARGFPIVATIIDYFDFRKLKISKGRGLAYLGECLLGAEAARALNLQPGDSLISSPESLFDLAGVYPLKMKVVGIVAATQSADDRAVFVDLKTGWVIAGIGHGHTDVEQAGDPTVILERKDDNIIANTKLMEYTEITEQNLDSFYFHGNPE